MAGEITKQELIPSLSIAIPEMATTTNVDNAYSVTLTNPPKSYTEGFGLVVTINADSTGAATINVNGLGPKAIVKANGNAVTNLKENGIYTLRYNATTGNFILQGEGGEYGTAAAPQVLTGYTFGTENGLVNGSMPDRGAVKGVLNAGGMYTILPGYHNGAGVVTANSLASQTVADATTVDILSGKTAWVNGEKITGAIPLKAAATITPGTTNQTISAGQYLSGAQTILGDSDLVASNIKTGINIFGVTGTLNPYGPIAGSNLYIEMPNLPRIGYSQTTMYRLTGSVRMNYAGTIRVIFEADRADEYTAMVYYQVYKNGNPVGILRSFSGESGQSLTFSEDFTCQPADIFSIWGRGSVSSSNDSWEPNVIFAGIYITETHIAEVV